MGGETGERGEMDGDGDTREGMSDEGVNANGGAE